MTHQIDAMITGASSGLQLEETKRGRLLFPAPRSSAISSITRSSRPNTIMKDNPQAVRAFLKGGFETIAYERAHRDKTIAYAVKAMRRSPEIETKEYDFVMPEFLPDGRFQANALKVMARSFVELGQLDSEPDRTKYHTEKFLPETK